MYSRILFVLSHFGLPWWKRNNEMGVSYIMKTFFLQFIFSSALNWIPLVFFAAIIIGASYVYFRISSSRRRAIFVKLIWITIGFRVLFAILKTVLQYYAWASNEMGKLLLPPAQSIAVFARYAWTHFWINILISIGVGLFMFAILKTLQKKNARFFDEGEVELGTLMTFVVGWPHFVIFFPLVFLCVVFFSIVRGIFLKQPFTTLGMPLIVAAVIALPFALSALTALHLGALVI